MLSTGERRRVGSRRERREEEEERREEREGRSLRAQAADFPIRTLIAGQHVLISRCCLYKHAYLKTIAVANS